MTEYTKQIQNLSDDEIRELFGEKISADEKMLWHDGGFFTYRTDNSIGGIVGVSAFALCSYALAVTQIMAGKEVPFFAFAIITLVAALAITLFYDDRVSHVYPRYYVLTDKNIASCKRGIFGRTSCKKISLDDICCVTLHDEKKGAAVVISQKGTSDETIEISGVDNTEYVKNIIADAAGLNETPNCFR